MAKKMETTVKISGTGKMPCGSWSLQALETCAGSYDANGALVPGCETCYALGGNYLRPNVIAAREYNKKDWKRDAWVAEMVFEIKKGRYFRWFDSGDVYSIKLAEKILEIMIATPTVKHWLPTKMYKFGKYAEVFARMNSLKNVVVRFSSDHIDGTTIDGEYTSTIVPNKSFLPEGAKLCGAYNRDGKCGACRACWSKDKAVIAYPAHGQKGKKHAKQVIIARAA